MNKSLAAVWLTLLFGTAQALPITPRPVDRPASAAAQTAPAPLPDLDDDEAAPPVHIHHAHASKKTARKPVAKKADPQKRPQRYSLLLPD